MNRSLFSKTPTRGCGGSGCCGGCGCGCCCGCFGTHIIRMCMSTCGKRLRTVPGDVGPCKPICGPTWMSSASSWHHHPPFHAHELLVHSIFWGLAATYTKKMSLTSVFFVSRILLGKSCYDPSKTEPTRPNKKQSITCVVVVVVVIVVVIVVLVVIVVVVFCYCYCYCCCYCCYCCFCFCFCCCFLLFLLLSSLSLSFTCVCPQCEVVQLKTNVMGQCLCTGPYPLVTDTGPKTPLVRQSPDSDQISARYEGLMEIMSRIQVQQAQALQAVEASTVHASPCCETREKSPRRAGRESTTGSESTQHVENEGNSSKSLQELTR